MIRDTANILSISVTFLLLLTPVLYLKPASGLLSKASEYNLVYYLISAPREIILSGRISHPTGFLISVIASVFVFLIGLMLFHIAEPRIAERV
jgi:lipopolysaccharide transport system permease protein